MKELIENISGINRWIHLTSLIHVLQMVPLTGSSHHGYRFLVKGGYARHDYRLDQEEKESLWKK
ncbi:hypothetical protein DES34_107229 [Brevibacillus brevis]|nr:hypothetical protein C7J99_00210 [Brevibacillus brevis]RED28878.1 hypothetical protein DES34_107229 [Brevibacillus brevis]TQK62000.1 hypothetical protein FB479_10683 [Brevibacillus sp. AG162]GEC90311.1 hypothetical protein BBR01nite_26420 [Brevibacillus brevis]VEF91527.1 Uncharacterised protein [Brevibacillus brevis]